MNQQILQEAYNAMLLKAASENNIEDVIEALTLGADINCTDSDGATPLVLAALSTDITVYAYLKQQGANPKLEDNFGMTALSYLDANEDYYIDTLEVEAAIRESLEELL
jgi:serine/threonine-protein phosphatase 6 regulatory ankyrin repeat subunit B